MPHAVAVSTPSPREVVVSRVFDAPVQLVFDCHTQPQLVRRWLLGPPGWSMPVCEIDLRVGGGYRYRWRNDADGMEFGATGTYTEIDAPNRIVMIERMEGFDGESLCTTTFVEVDGRTTMTISMQFPSEAARDQAVATGMADGMGASYSMLDGVLADLQK